MGVEFEGWPKTPHWYRDIVVTEKIDGTNAAIQIVPEDEPDGSGWVTNLAVDGARYTVAAQSRKRLITPTDDNAGFAKWVYANAETLISDLGPGRHFGEWWGQGIQRNYGLSEKRFSLFNTAKWWGKAFQTPQLHVVPVMYEGPNEDWEIEWCLDSLFAGGSWAAEGFHNPEGVVVYHTAANKVFKILLDGDETPKSLKVNQ